MGRESGKESVAQESSSFLLFWATGKISFYFLNLGSTFSTLSTLSKLSKLSVASFTFPLNLGPKINFIFFAGSQLSHMKQKRSTLPSVSQKMSRGGMPWERPVGRHGQYSVCGVGFPPMADPI